MHIEFNLFNKELINNKIENIEKYWREGLDLKHDKFFGVAGSTFRAYKGHKYPPSKTYKEWVNTFFEDNKLKKELSKCSDRNTFLLIHKKITDDLDFFFKTNNPNSQKNGGLSISKKFKLVDLFIKYLCLSKRNRNEFKRLYYFCNIPIDKWSLLALKKHVKGIVLSNKPSMGDIKDEESYFIVQELIFGATQTINIPNLYFDIYAWEMKDELIE